MWTKVYDSIHLVDKKGLDKQDNRNQQTCDYLINTEYKLTLTIAVPESSGITLRATPT